MKLLEVVRNGSLSWWCSSRPGSVFGVTPEFFSNSIAVSTALDSALE